MGSIYIHVEKVQKSQMYGWMNDNKLNTPVLLLPG